MTSAVSGTPGSDVSLPSDRPPSDRTMTRFYRFIWLLARFILRVGLGHRAEGLENLPAEGGLLAANHKSYLDPPAVGTAVPVPVHYLAKEQLFKYGWSNAFLSRLLAIPIRRERPTMSQLGRCLKILKGGGYLVLFPEGTRIRRDGLAKPRPGLGFFVRRTGAPVVPVYVRGTFRWRDAMLRRRPLRIRFGPPLSFSEADDDASIGHRVIQAIAALADPRDKNVE